MTIVDILFPFFGEKHNILMAMHGEYNLWMVSVSIFIAIFSSFTAFHLSAFLASIHKAKVRKTLHALSSFVLAVGIWAMHFIAMLAFKMGHPVNYDITITLISFIPAMAAASVALNTMSSTNNSAFDVLLRGTVMGGGIGLMHYIGMNAMQMNADIYYHPSLFVLSIILAVVLSLLSLSTKPFLTKYKKGYHKSAIPLVGGIIMGCSITAMHYMGMAATVFLPNDDVVIYSSFTAESLAIEVAILSFITIFIAFITISTMKKSHHSLEFGRTRYRKITFYTILSLFGLVVLMSFIIFDFNKQKVLKDTKYSLQSVLSMASAGLNLWIADKKAYLGEIGTNSELVHLTEELIKKSINQGNFKSSVSQLDIRHFFQVRNKSFGETGFFIINPEGVSIASRRDVNIGTLNLIAKQKPELFNKVLQGENVFVPPINSDVLIGESQTTMFIMAPIYSTNGAVIAALAQRLIPEKDFSRILQVGKVGLSGETYAFDETGLLLSQSRFDKHLRKVGIIKGKQQTILSVRIKDPGGNLLEGYKPKVPSNQLPLPKMAISATQKESSSNMEAYRDYRGVPVFGTWIWSDTLGIGMTTEIDVAEALDGFRLMQWSMVSVFIVLLLIVSASLIFTTLSAERANKLLAKAKEDLEEKVKIRTKDLVIAKEAAEVAALSKASFLSNMSHEIRTPMNSILGFLHIALDSNQLHKDLRIHLDTAYNSAKGLLVIINDILDVSKLESGQMTLEKIIINIPYLVKDALRLLQPNAKSKGLTLEFQYDSKLSHCFEGDGSRLRQVIINLVGNSIKFTKTGGVVVSISQAEESGKILFAISDTGIGMSKKQIDCVFQAFSQADDSISRRFGGTGLGTTISKNIIEKMNGHIWIESEEGKGSTFYFTIAIPEASCKAYCVDVGITSEAPQLHSLRCFNVLIAEDIAENAALVAFRLKEQGHTITWVKNGKEAVEAFKKSEYDIILMDIQMPEMDGLTATRIIREIEAESKSHIQIIALTASILLEDVNECIQSGMDQVIGKPIDFTELFSAMEKGVQSDKGKKNDTFSVQLTQSPSIDFSPLNEVANTKKGLVTWQNPEVYADALLNFAKEHSQSGNKIKTAMTVDLKVVKNMVHTLKGLAGNLYLEKTAQLSMDIDNAIRTEEKTLAKELVNQLQQELDNVTFAIKNLIITRDIKVIETKTFDPDIVKELLQQTLSAFEELNPDPADEMIEKLRMYVSEDDIYTIDQCLKNFDFDEASNKLYKLAEKLGVNIEDK